MFNKIIISFNKCFLGHACVLLFQSTSYILESTTHAVDISISDFLGFKSGFFEDLIASQQGQGIKWEWKRAPQSNPRFGMNNGHAN